MLHGTIFIDDFLVSCNRPLAKNFYIGEALRVFDPTSKTRNAEWGKKPKTAGNKTK